MRSRLEATFAAQMDSDGLAWEYEPECFADETGQYLPDFARWDPGYLPSATEGYYVEVKPSAPPGTAIEIVQRRMEIIWSSKPDALLRIWTPRETWLAIPRHWDPLDVDDTWEYLDGEDD